MKIYRNTVSDLLWELLTKLMSLTELSPFRLVGGTSLSLLLGHRKSVDIDLFTDAEYGSIDFGLLDELLQKTFNHVDIGYTGNRSPGKTYYIGYNKNEMVKVDMFYTDLFTSAPINYKSIRLSRPEEIVAMKLEVIGNGGRKKDFWDIHELMEYFTWDEMFKFYEKRYPYNFTRNELINQLSNFKEADNDFDPICLKSKCWELIKLDIEQSIKQNFPQL